MSHNSFIKYALEDIKDLHGEALSAVALDKRQDDEVRLAALQKHGGVDLASQVVEEEDNPPELQANAEEILTTRQLVMRSLADEEGTHP